MDKQNLVVDTDPGLDDALALSYLWQNHDIDLITTVAGNASLKDVTDNATALRDEHDSTTPIRKGASAPIEAKQVIGDFHGQNGLGSINTSPTTVNDFHTDQLPDNPIFLAIGPLTNIADMVSAVPQGTRCFILGGTLAEGTIHGEEFNFYADPHAATRVLQSHLDITLLPIDTASPHGIPVNDADTYHTGQTMMQRVWDEHRRASQRVQASHVTPYDLILAHLVFNRDQYKTTPYDVTVHTGRQRRGHLETHDGQSVDIITDLQDGVTEQALSKTL